jgi:hypothetical protein
MVRRKETRVRAHALPETPVRWHSHLPSTSEESEETVVSTVCVESERL